MGKCRCCGVESRLISSFLGLCASCARNADAKGIAADAHDRSLASFGLKPSNGHAASCTQCVNRCSMDEGMIGRCGLRRCESGFVRPVLGGAALVDWYYDPLPTNCVAEWVCEGGGMEPRGLRNLAVFFRGCSFDCLFCQNWHHREGVSELKSQRSATSLVGCVDDMTSCVCFFGGDPTPQLEFAFECSDLLVSRKVPPRICWETNGSMSRPLAERLADFSIRTQGYVKFDLKAFDENLHVALCGSSNRNTLSNFERLGRRIIDSNHSPLVASTLMVPDYVEADEVSEIGSFIASIDESIPYSLLAFHPDYLMEDLPTTSRRQADECFRAAKASGLRNVHVGNVHVLS